MLLYFVVYLMNKLWMVFVGMQQLVAEKSFFDKIDHVSSDIFHHKILLLIDSFRRSAV